MLSSGSSRSDISWRLALGVGVQNGAGSVRTVPSRSVLRPIPLDLAEAPGVVGAGGPVGPRALLSLADSDPVDPAELLFFDDAFFFLL